MGGKAAAVDVRPPPAAGAHAARTSAAITAARLATATRRTFKTLLLTPYGTAACWRRPLLDASEPVGRLSQDIRCSVGG